MSGNHLNFNNMHRIDLIRWALTGGRPTTCTSFASNKCDPELWKTNTGAGLVGSVCNDSLDLDGDGVADGGCILSLDNGNNVYVRVGQSERWSYYPIHELNNKAQNRCDVF